MITLFGVLWTPLFAKIFSLLPDRGYALAKIFALFIFVYFAWLINFVYPDIFSKNGLSFFLSLNIASLLYMASKREKPNIGIKQVLLSEGIFLIFFVFVLMQFGFHPDFYNGEKPMDMNLLSYFYRWEGGTIEDPWFSGERLHYYYFGYLTYASLAKVTGVSSTLAYPLALATSMGAMASILFSMFSFLTEKVKRGFFLSLIFMLATNIKTIWLFLQNPNFDLSKFWQVSRVFKEGEFAEFPLWSFLFGDLHPHVMAYPLTISGILVILYGLKHLKVQKDTFKVHYVGNLWGFGFVAAFFYGSLLAVNGWDFLLMSLLYSLLYIGLAANERRLKFLIPLFLIHCLGLLLFFPMYFQYQSGKELILSFYRGQGNQLFSYFLFSGHWLLIFLIALRGKRKESLFQYSGILILLLGVIILLENIVFIDRINTIFKGLTTINYLIGIVCLAMLGSSKRRTLVIIGLILCLPSLSLFIGVSQNHAFGENRFTLNGYRYLEKVDLDRYQLVDWIQNNIRGTPTILEGHSSSFDYNGASISALTGLPSYLGWENHVAIRGQKWPKIFRRKGFVEKVYQSPDALQVHNELVQEGIEYVVLGKYERSKYRSIGTAKFNQYKELFYPVGKFGDTILYKIKVSENRGKN